MAKPQRCKPEFTGGYSKPYTDFILCDDVMPLFQTLELSKGSKRLNNEVPCGTQCKAGCDPLCANPPQHPIPYSWGYFGCIKSQICIQPALIGLTVSSCPRLTSGSGGVNPIARKHSYVVTLHAPRQGIHWMRLDSVLSNNLTFAEEKEPIKNSCTAHRNVCLHSSFTDMCLAPGVLSFRLCFFLLHIRLQHVACEWGAVEKQAVLPLPFASPLRWKGSSFMRSQVNLIVSYMRHHNLRGFIFNFGQNYNSH